MRRLLLVGATLLALGASLSGAGPASAAEPQVLLSPEEVTTALFVAGDVSRLSKVRGGTEELVLEKVLQQMYTDNPSLNAGTAEGEISELKRLLSCPQAPTQASLQVMAGNQRILAILAALESEGYCSPPVELSHFPDAKLAVTHLAGVALASSSDVFANADTPKYFEPLADERSNLIYSSFAPATVLRATHDLAGHNFGFATARDALWKTASGESVSAGEEQLIFEVELFRNSFPLNELVNTVLAEGGSLLTTRGELTALFHESQMRTQATACAHGSGEEKLGAETIPGVPRLTCNGGALYEAANSHACTTACEAQLTEVKTRAKEREAIVAEERSYMTAQAELLRPVEATAASVEQATAQAQAQVTEEENEYAKFEAEQKTRNIIKGSLKIIGEIAGSIVSFATKSPSEGVNGLIGAAFEIYSLTEESLVNPPPGPQEIALKDMTALSNQLSGFQQYTQEAFRALNTQVAQLTSQLAQDTYELKFEIGSLAEKMAFEQQTIFQLEDEVQTLFSTQAKAELQTTIADSVGWLKRTGELLSPSKLQESLVALQKYATEIANGALVNNSETQPYTFEGAGIQLASKKTGEPVELNEAITYLEHFPVEKGWETSAIPTTLANTTFWSEGARAYAQLMLENTSHVSAPNKAGLKALEDEGLTLEKAQFPWSEHSGGAKTGNAILDHALLEFEQAAAGNGVEGKRSVAKVLEEAAERTFTGGLKTRTGITGNPTNVALWGGAVQGFSKTQLAEEKYPALKWGYNKASFEATPEIECLPEWLATGVRAGIVGAKGSGDEWEVVFEPEPHSECPEVKLYARGAATPTLSGTTEFLTQFYNPQGVAYINTGLLVLQKEAYEVGLEEFKKETGPANRLAGARALVQSYTKLGLPQALSSDPVLETEIEGTGAQFLDPEPGTPRPVPEELTALVRSWTERVAKEEKAPEESKAREDLIGEIAKRSSAWAAEVAKTVKPYIEGNAPEFTESGGEAVSEQSPIVESTVNRLRLTKDLLAESKAPDAQTLAPTGIGITEATLNGEVNPNGAEVESCEFEYGPSTHYGHRVGCTPIPPPSEKATVVSAKVANWTEAGGFDERLVVKTWGGTTYGDNVKVQLGQPAAPPTAPSVATTGASIGYHTATLEGTVNPNGATVTSCQFTVEEVLAGLPTGHNKTVPCAVGPGSGSEPVVVTALDTELSPGTEYRFFLAATNAVGSASSEPPSPFTTTVLPGPTVVTGVAAQIRRRAALLHGTVNPNGIAVAKCWATIQEVVVKEGKEQPGKEPPLDFACIEGVGTGHSPTAVLVNARKLHARTKYSFQLHAESIEGGEGVGAIEKFETIGKRKKATGRSTRTRT